MTPTPAPHNRIKVKGSTTGPVTSIGGDNNGVINLRTIIGMPEDEPGHTLHVEGRRPTFVTDRVMLALTMVMALTSLGSLAVAVIQAYPAITQYGFGVPSVLGLVPGLLVFLGVVTGGVALLLMLAGAWLRRLVYGRLPFLNRLPEGRVDEHGRHRVYLTKVTGTCGVEGAPMRLAALPTKRVPVQRADGSWDVKRTGYRAHLVCTKNGKDHVALIDPALTSPE